MDRPEKLCKDCKHCSLNTAAVVPAEYRISTVDGHMLIGCTLTGYIELVEGRHMNMNSCRHERSIQGLCGPHAKRFLSVSFAAQLHPPYPFGR